MTGTRGVDQIEEFEFWQIGKHSIWLQGALKTGEQTDRAIIICSKIHYFIHNTLLSFNPSVLFCKSLFGKVPHFRIQFRHDDEGRLRGALPRPEETDLVLLGLLV